MPDNHRHPVFILTGPPGSGKTTFLLQLIADLRKRTISMAGFAAVSVPSDGPSKDYQILDLASGETLPLASRMNTAGWEPCGNFFFNPEGIGMGLRILDGPDASDSDLFVLDEIGPFELQGKIWADSLTRLLDRKNGGLLLVVRASLVDRVLVNWNLEGAEKIDIRNTQPEKAAAEIGTKIRGAGE